MHHKPLKIWIVCLIALTCLLLVWHKFGMNKQIRLDASGGFNYRVYDDRMFDGESVAAFEKRGEKLILKCQFSKTYRWPHCGFELDLKSQGLAFDLSSYDRVEIDLETTAETNWVRIFLRNENEAYTLPGDLDTLKANELNFNPQEESNPFVTDLESFQVAMWWINEFEIPPIYAERDLSNIVNIGFGFGQSTDENMHEMAVKSMTFHGKWVSQAEVQSFIIALWIASAFGYLLLSFVSAQRAMLTISKEKDELEELNTALEIERRELETLATRDSLTGVYNRFGLRNHLHVQTTLVKQNNTELSIIFIDIDNYKDINDKHGHTTGDEVLKVFCELIEKNTRTQDVFCRWGGDEFILLCHGTGLSSAKQLAEKIRDLVTQQKWPLSLRVTCSLGVAQMNPDESIGSFIKRADESLYAAKEDGRNRVVAGDKIA